MSTFLELQNDVIERFTEADRPKVKTWINMFGAQLYYAEEWTWRFATYLPTVFAGSFAAGNEPENMGRPIDVHNAQGQALTPMEPADFYRAYQGFSQTTTGKPESFSFFDNALAGPHGGLLIGPASNETANYFCTFWARWVTLLEDDDEPADMPDAFHWLLVSGALALGQSHTQDPTAAMQDPVVQNGLATMRREYVSATPRAVEVWSRN